VRGRHAGTNRNSTANGKDSLMTLRAKRNETLELHATPIKPLAADTPSNHAPTHEEIRRRAYEIYLERDGFGCNELDDWLQAEMELVSDALLARTAKETKRKG
jgi:hypothetical protein